LQGVLFETASPDYDIDRSENISELDLSKFKVSFLSSTCSSLYDATILSILALNNLGMQVDTVVSQPLPRGGNMNQKLINSMSIL